MIDPGFLDELARFEAGLDRRIDSRIQGQQRSKDVGEGLTFSDHRRYSPGDDTGRVDWRVYARTEELYVKQYESERNLTMHVLVDASASMDYGELGDPETGDQGTHKFETAAKIGLGFASLAADEHNDFRVSLLGETAERIDRDQSTHGEVLRLIDVCNDLELTGATDFQQACEDYAATIDSKSLVLVASDFLDDPDTIEAGLAALPRSELTLARVLTPDERDPPARGETIFEDPETETSLRTYFGTNVAKQYRQRLEDHLTAVEAIADRQGARHVPVDTGDDFFDSFADVWVE
jgi:uncharacterized protein (DUF58 family)